MFHGTASKEIKMCVYTESPTKNFFFIKIKIKKVGNKIKDFKIVMLCLLSLGSNFI